jgi:hypothetical protein
MRIKAPKTAGRTAVYMFDVVLVEEVDWEVDVEEEIEDEAGAESVEDGEVTLAGTFEDDCGVLIGKAVCEATGCNVVFVASTVVVPVAESSSGLNRVSLRDRIGGRMQDAVVFTASKTHGVDASQTSMEMPCSESRQGTLPT